MRPLFRFAVWSNIFYLVPLTAAAYFELWGFAVLLAILIVFSTVFHYSYEQSFILVDKLFAYAVVVVNIILLALGGINLSYFALVGATLLLGLYVRYIKEGESRGGFYHGLWHLCAASVTLICILTYAT